MIHKMNELVKLIEMYGLKTSKRNRELVYQRFYMYKELRKWLTLEQVGRLFGKDHATVIYGIKMARMFEHMNDTMYFEYIKHIRADYMAMLDGKSVFGLRKIDYVNGTAIMYVNIPMERDVYDSIEDVDICQFKEVLECVMSV